MDSIKCFAFSQRIHSRGTCKIINFPRLVISFWVLFLDCRKAFRRRNSISSFVIYWQKIRRFHENSRSFPRSRQRVQGQSNTYELSILEVATVTVDCFCRFFSFSSTPISKKIWESWNFLDWKKKMHQLQGFFSYEIVSVLVIYYVFF